MDEGVVVGAAIHVAQEVGYRQWRLAIVELDIDHAEDGLQAHGGRLSGQGQKKQQCG